MEDGDVLKVNKRGCLLVREVKVCELFSNIVFKSVSFQSIYKKKKKKMPFLNQISPVLHIFDMSDFMATTLSAPL